MRFMPALLSVVLSLALLSSQTTWAQERKKIAVFDLELDVDLSSTGAKALNEIQLAEFARSRLLDVMGSSDILAMMQLQERKVAFTNCTDDNCMADIGGALGAHYLASTNVGKIGQTLAVTVKVIDVREVTVLARVSETVAAGESQLIPTLKLAIAKTIEQLTGETGLVATLLQAPDDPVTFVEVAPWVTLGVGILAGCASAVSGGLALKDAEASREEFAGSPSWQDAHDAMETKALASDILLGVAGAAIVSTILLFVLNGSDDSDQASNSPLITTGRSSSWIVRF